MGTSLERRAPFFLPSHLLIFRLTMSLDPFGSSVSHVHSSCLTRALASHLMLSHHVEDSFDISHIGLLLNKVLVAAAGSSCQ